MAQEVAKEVRARMMSAVRGKDTKPELAVRRGLHALGFRYSLHSRKLAGRPDLVLPKYRAAVWIHGCFWHGHGCQDCRPARSRTEFWGPKVARTRERDAEAIGAALKAGWRCLVIWECSLKPGDVAATVSRVAEWLRGDGQLGEFEGSLSGSSAPSSTASSGVASGTAFPAR
jgi:DNA mismatch endonuclease, patch repair protein